MLPLGLEIPYSRFTLANGLTLLVHEDRGLPLVAVNLWYHVGSAHERPGRTGLAHLFEHLMFEGSAHVPEGEFDLRLEEAGGVNNGSTTPDRTNYWMTLPSGALELALWLESDRMGWLLEALDGEKLELQRSVVKNERRQVYENQPYGRAWETLSSALYPATHPYHWPVIGWMEDLDAATLDDVGSFFRTWYAPGNASLVVAGDVEAERVRTLVDQYFGAIPGGPGVPGVGAPDPALPEERTLVLEDEVHLPRLYLSWHSPGAFRDGEAEMEVAALLLGEGRSSRLHRRLVYREELAQDVAAYHDRGRLGGGFHLVVTGRPGMPLEPLARAVREELLALAEEEIPEGEMEGARTRVEAGFVRGLQRLGGFDGRADRLNEYLFHTGDPGFLPRDLDRYRGVTPGGVAAGVERLLLRSPGVALSVVPRGRADLAAERGGR